MKNVDGVIGCAPEKSARTNDRPHKEFAPMNDRADEELRGGADKRSRG